MTRYLPIFLGVVLIVGLTIPQFIMTDRHRGSNVTAEQRAELLKRVPKKIGNWHGEDKPVDEAVREGAGAVGAVSREYRNVRTGDKVDLWLIVGHGRPICGHTPNICYRTAGFQARAEEDSLYPIVFGDNEEAPFWTNTFFKEDVTGRSLIRVFWSWYNTEGEHEGKVVWEAPTNQRRSFGNTRALFKMYFTSEMRDQMETAEQSPCLQFAEEFLPVVNKALSAVYSESDVTDAADEKTAAKPAPSQATNEDAVDDSAETTEFADETAESADESKELFDAAATEAESETKAALPQ